MDSKSIFASKTLWVNLLGPFFAWLASKGLALTPDQQLAFVGIGMAGVNVLLRLFTKQPVHVVTPPSAVVAILAAGVLTALTACGTLTNPDGSPMTTQQRLAHDLKVTCELWAADKPSLKTIVHDTLSPDTAAQLDSAGTAADQYCLSPTPPADLEEALIKVQAAVLAAGVAMAEDAKAKDAAAAAAPAKP